MKRPATRDEAIAYVDRQMAKVSMRNRVKIRGPKGPTWIHCDDDTLVALIADGCVLEHKLL